MGTRDKHVRILHGVPHAPTHLLTGTGPAPSMSCTSTLRKLAAGPKPQQQARSARGDRWVSSQNPERLSRASSGPSKRRLGALHRVPGNTMCPSLTRWRRGRIPRRARSTSLLTLCGQMTRRHNIRSSMSTKSVHRRCAIVRQRY
jgi:hypothetical protein